MTGTIRTLRDMVPIRALTHVEAVSIAEQQARRLLELSGVQAPPVPDQIIVSLPRLQVERVALGDTSGATQWSRGRWLLLLNSSEPATRQRFSLAHEFKHVLDNPFVSMLYPPTRGMTTLQRQERICDHFAACLLMPRAWVKQRYCNEGTQDASRLATRFGVSPQAMRYRLHLIGLVESTIRCGFSEPTQEPSGLPAHPSRRRERQFA